MKFSKYNIVEETEKALVIFNPLYSNYVKITTDADIKKFNNLLETKIFDIADPMVKALYQRNYIIDKEIDEYEVALNKVNECVKGFDKKCTLLLYVTEQCNFRCIYCPEDHVNKRFSEENWDSLYRHIEKNVRNGQYEFVRISFFGGEPLLETSSILKFLDRLELLKNEYPEVVFKHEMTTNGYLLTPEIYDKLTRYDVKHYQITIDGFADVHNKTRPLVNGGGTWERIIENLKYINTKDDNVTINFRANISPLNQDSIQEFMDWSMQTFDNKKFTFSAETVIANTENVPEELATDYQSKEYQEIDTFMNHSNRGFSKEEVKPLKLLGFSCRYATKNFYTITTDGNISKCGEAAFGLTEVVGKLLPDGDFEFFDNYIDWTEGFEIEACKDCNVYPLCGARSCLYKKVHSDEQGRMDCSFMQEHKQMIGKYIRDGLLG